MVSKTMPRRMEAEVGLQSMLPPHAYMENTLRDLHYLADLLRPVRPSLPVLNDAPGSAGRQRDPVIGSRRQMMDSNPPRLR